MHSTQLLSLLIGVAAATPFIPRDNPINLAAHSPEARAAKLRRGTYLASETLEACKAASNCETYEDPVFGTRIRFADGKGPGSEHYKRHVQARDDVKTHVTVGDTTINYGNSKASGTGGVIHHLYDICHEGSCDTNAKEISSHYAGQTSEYDQNIVLHASGQYNGWDERNAFVEAVVLVAGTDEECYDQKWGNGGGYYGGAVTGKLNMCKQTNYIGVNRFVNGNLQGFMEVRAELEDQDGGWCAKLLGAAGGIAGGIAAIPGLEVAGGASGFFGFLSVFCQ